MATPTVSIDITAVLNAASKADGNSVSAAELGVSALVNAVAATLPDGERAIQSATSLELTPEAMAAANARTEEYYAVRMQARTVRTGTVTPGNTTSHVRFNSTSNRPQIRIGYNDGFIGFSASHGAGNLHQLTQSTTGTGQMQVPHGRSYEWCWVFRRSPDTAADMFVGFYVDGQLACGASEHADVDAINFSGRLIVFPSVSGITWQIHGSIDVYSIDGLDEVVRQTGASRSFITSGAATAHVPPGVTFSRSGVTVTDERQGIGTGINNGNSAAVVVGGEGSSDSVIFEPVEPIGFNSRGYLHASWHQVTSAAATVVSVKIQTDAGADIAEVRIRDSGLDGPVIDYRADGGGDYTVLASSGVTLAHLHAVRLSQRDNGEVSIIVKDDDADGGGVVWAATVATSHTEPFRRVRYTRTGTYLSETTTRRGHCEIEQWPMADVYVDSWGTGPAGSAPKNTVPNHLLRALRGSRVGERLNGFNGEPVGEGEPWEFLASGSCVFARAGWSIATWVSNSPAFPDHVRGSVAIAGLSAMNTMVSDASTINAGGSGLLALIDTTAGQYADAVERMLANRNTVWWIGFVAPPAGGEHTEAQQQFIRDLNTEVLDRLGSLTVPAGSLLVISDPEGYANSLDPPQDPAADLAWDAPEIHPAGESTARQIVDWAIASAQFREGEDPVSTIIRARTRYADERGTASRRGTR